MTLQSSESSKKQIRLEDKPNNYERSSAKNLYKPPNTFPNFAYGTQNSKLREHKIEYLTN